MICIIFLFLMVNWHNNCTYLYRWEIHINTCKQCVMTNSGNWQTSHEIFTIPLYGEHSQPPLIAHLHYEVASIVTLLCLKTLSFSCVSVCPWISDGFHCSIIIKQSENHRWLLFIENKFSYNVFWALFPLHHLFLDHSYPSSSTPHVLVRVSIAGIKHHDWKTSC